MHLRDCTNAFAGPSERRTTVTEAAAVAAKEVRDTLGLLLAAVHTNTIQHSPVCYARFPCNSDIYAAGDVNTLGTGYVRVTREVRSTLEQACIGVRSDCIRFRNTLARSITTQCAANRYKPSLHLTAPGAAVKLSSDQQHTHLLEEGHRHRIASSLLTVSLPTGFTTSETAIQIIHTGVAAAFC